MIGARVKDPQDIRTYTFNWAAWLTSIGSDTIATSVWVVPTGITSVSESNDTTLANIRISGGTAGVTYEISNRVTTTAGEVRQVSFELGVEAQ
jgi:hypothetical protein